MANLAYLSFVFCSNGHFRRKMYFAGFDFAGNAKYRCPICGSIHRYRLIFGQVKRVA